MYKKAKTIPYTLSLGLDFPQIPSNMKSSIREAEENYFDFALVTLFKENNFRDD